MRRVCRSKALSCFHIFGVDGEEPSTSPGAVRKAPVVLSSRADCQSAKSHDDYRIAEDYLILAVPTG